MNMANKSLTLWTNEIINKVFNETNVTNFTDPDSMAEYPAWKKDLRFYLNINVITFPIIFLLSAGCDIKLKNIVGHIKHPASLCIGMFCQFIVLPLTTFVILLIINIGAMYSLFIIIFSCCPGGPASNSYTYLFNGDLSLSICMTFIATFMANFMIPLNLWLYGRYFETSDFVIPYIRICIVLVMIAVLVTSGMIIRWKNTGLAKRIAKFGNSLGLILFLVQITVDIIIYPEIYLSIPPKMMIIAAMYNPVFFCVGYFIAVLLKRSFPVRIAISIETSTQNMPLAAAIVILSFPLEIQLKFFGIPWFYIIGWFALAVVSYICKVLVRLNERLAESSKEHNETNAPDTEEQESTYIHHPQCNIVPHVE